MNKQQSAVNKLIRLANSSCGSSRAAAAVLLSAYDPTNYPLEITELCLFDEEYLAAAMMVISLRVWNGKEPHELLVDGGSVFRRLVDDWGNALHINNRAA